jgi:isocitrate dehydrogenase
MKITIEKGELAVPYNPTIPFIEGDGIGVDITPAMRRIVDASVKEAYGGKRKIDWLELLAGEKGQDKRGEPLPEVTIQSLREHRVSIKGPLTTPVGSGFRSLNLAIRQILDLYAIVRPVYWVEGVPSPMVHPEKMDMVIFREGTEDLYAGIEWKVGSEESRKLVRFLREEFGIELRSDSGIGLKPMSEFRSKRLVRKAIGYALKNGRRSLTLVHKGNIMKFTEGSFKEWGYEVAREEFADNIINDDEVMDGWVPKGKVIIRDRLADNMLQQLLTRTDEYDVIATTNLNGDYIADAASGQVGGLGVVPSGNLGDGMMVFEATHGSAPKYAGQDIANPIALTLAARLMLEQIGWTKAAELIYAGIAEAIKGKAVTPDLARQMSGAREVGTSEFADIVIESIKNIKIAD